MARQKGLCTNNDLLSCIVGKKKVVSGAGYNVWQQQTQGRSGEFKTEQQTPSEVLVSRFGAIGPRVPC